MNYKEFAEILFSSLPKEPCSIQILSENVEDPDYESYSFEILLNIFMEACINYDKLFKILRKQLNNPSICTENLIIAQPWFKSFGYSFSVNEYEEYDYLHDNTQYCRILFDNNDGKYCFVLNTNYVPSKLNDIKAIFNHSNKIYVVKFAHYIDNDKCGNCVL